MSDVVPNAAQGDDSQGEDGAAACDGPLHSRLFETLREDNFAGRLGDPAADRQTQMAIFSVVHFSCSDAKIIVGRAVRILAAHQTGRAAASITTPIISSIVQPAIPPTINLYRISSDRLPFN